MIKKIELYCIGLIDLPINITSLLKVQEDVLTISYDYETNMVISVVAGEECSDGFDGDIIVNNRLLDIPAFTPEGELLFIFNRG